MTQGNKLTPRILLIAGDGKGKTTAAIGVAVRFLGLGKKVLLSQFCKRQPSGELNSLAKFPEFSLFRSDCGFPVDKADPRFAKQRDSSRDLLDRVAEAMGGSDLLILDEICAAVNRHLVDLEQVRDVLRRLNPGQTAILTGRNPHIELVAMADTVSEILCLKHPFGKGIGAQEGVEY